MIEKIKSKMSAVIKSRRMRLAIASFLTVLAVASATLVNSSIHTIKVFDGHKTYTVRSFNNNVTLAIDSISLKSDDYEILKTESSSNHTTVEISYGFPVYITMGDTTTEVQMYEGTVADALHAAGYTPDKFDFVEPALDTVLKENTYIDYTNIDYIESTEQKSIPFKTKTTYSSKLDKGDKKITTEGKEGLKQITYTEKLVNGVSVEKKATKTITLAKATAQKVTVGTKTAYEASSKNGDYISVLSPKSEIKLDKNGVPVNYKSKMTVRATAYTHTGNPCSTGVMPKPGHIAVNPKVIPYGTKMFIKTSDGKYIYGYAVAADTGGFIKKHPTGIDLFFNSESECRKFGVRTAEIYILN